MTNPELRVTSLAELMSRPLEEPADLLGGWLYAGETAMLWAAPGVGKSMFALTVGLAVAGGGEFLGLKAPKPRPVLFIDGEMTAFRIRERVRGLIGGLEGLDQAKVGENFHWFARKDQEPGAVFPDIATEEGRKAVCRFANRHKPALVILDNFQSLAAVEDENVTTAFNETEHLMMELQRRGAATLMVHHSGKSGASYRGTSKMGGVFDSVVGLKRDDSAPLGQACFEIQIEKDRNGGTSNSLPGAARLLGGRWEAAENEGGTLERLVTLVKTGRYDSQAEVAKAAGVSQATVSRYLKLADARGILRSTDQEKLFAAAYEDTGDF